MKREPVDKAMVIGATAIADARAASAQAGRRLLTVLEESTALPADAFPAPWLAARGKVASAGGPHGDRTAPAPASTAACPR